MENNKMFNAFYASETRFDDGIEAYPVGDGIVVFFGDSAEEVRAIAERCGQLVNFVEVDESADDSYEGDIDHDIAVLREQRLGW